MPEFSALREAKVIERMMGPLAGLYVSKRTGQIDFSKIAMELKFDVDDEDDVATQNRELAKHMIARIWQGEQLSSTMPEIPYPFWDHNTWLDELEAAMITTEFLEASSVVKNEFITLYEKHRNYLAAIQESQTQAVQGQMMQGAMAQVTQQVAAKVAAETVETAMAQIQEQALMARRSPIERQLREAMVAGDREPPSRAPRQLPARAGAR